MLESLFNKVAGMKVCSCIKERLQQRHFPVNNTKFLADVLIVTKTKIDDSFSADYFFTEHFSKLNRLDRRRSGGFILDCVLKYILSEDIAKDSKRYEFFFVELNLIKTK